MGNYAEKPISELSTATTISQNDLILISQYESNNNLISRNSRVIDFLNIAVASKFYSKTQIDSQQAELLNSIIELLNSSLYELSSNMIDNIKTNFVRKTDNIDEHVDGIKTFDACPESTVGPQNDNSLVRNGSLGTAAFTDSESYASFTHNHDSTYSKLNHTHGNYIDKASVQEERWIFTLEDGNTVTKTVYLKI